MMCCCNNRNRCRCCGCCGSSEKNGNNAGSLLSNLSLSFESGNGTGLPVYLTIPAFLWGNNQEEDDDSSCGCGCNCGCWR